MNKSETQLRTNPRIVPQDLLLKFGYSPDNGFKFDSVASTLSFYQGGTKRVDINSFGLAVRDGEGLVVGHTTQVAAFGQTNEFNIAGTEAADTGMSVTSWRSSTVPAYITLGKSRSTSIGSGFTIVQDNDGLGAIRAVGDDGVDLNIPAAEILFSVDGTPGTDDIPGRIVFSTNAGGSGVTEALRIDSSQDTLLPATKKLVFDGVGKTTYIYEESSDDLHIVVGGLPLIQIDQDLLAGAGTMSFGGQAPNENRKFHFRPSAYTLPAGIVGHSVLNVNPIGITTPGTPETVTDLGSMTIYEPFITNGGGDTITNAFTLKIESAPTEGTNNYALWMPSGSLAVSDGDGASGEQLQSGGAGANVTWAAAASVRSSKRNIVERTDFDDALAKFVDVSVYDFNYRKSNGTRIPSTGDFDTNYVGIIADEAPWAMHHDGIILNPINTFGYTVLAIKALESRIRDLESQLAVG
ncbi:MAG: hypothetical protein IH867_11365 [Chloroflexi bacterium]|nr:hypothetical protein [Chloroflexota bacterium]